MRTLRGRVISGEGILEGEAVVFKEPLSFLGDVDGKSGVLRITGDVISGKFLVIPSSRGSTVGPYVMYQLSKYGKAPLAILSTRADGMLIMGAILSRIPLVTDLPEEVLNIPTGARLRVDLDRGEVMIL